MPACRHSQRPKDTSQLCLEVSKVMEEKMNQELLKIRDLQKKAALRKKEGLFVVEGSRLCEELPADLCIRTVVSDTYVKRFRKPEGAVQIRDQEFERICDTKTPQGILKLARMLEYTEEEILTCDNGLFLLLERVQDPGNLGTMIRTAEAAGVSGIVLDQDCCDIYNPKVLRGTMGSVFRMKFAVTGDLPGTVRKIQDRSGHVFAATLKDSLPYDETDYTGVTAFLIGNEGNGLTDKIQALADSRIHIPMEGKAESLNAAIAASVLMFEAKRQRKKRKA